MKMDKGQAEEVLGSPLWRFVENELDYRIGLLMERFTLCNESDFKLIQKEIQVLQEVKRIPRDVKDREE